MDKTDKKTVINKLVTERHQLIAKFANKETPIEDKAALYLAIKLTEAQIQVVLATPLAIPNYVPGGIVPMSKGRSVVGERGKEMIFKPKRS